MTLENLQQLKVGDVPRPLRARKEEVLVAGGEKVS
jgi:hypothetical protein